MSKEVLDKTPQRPSSHKCPPGLECLLPTSALIIAKNLELLESLLGIETENSYVIYNQVHNVQLWAQSTSSFLDRLCIPHLRPVDIKVFDILKKKLVISVRRPLRCLCCCLPQFSPVMNIFTADGMFIGRVRKRCYCFVPELEVIDANNEIVFYITGMCCCNCCQVDFHVLSKNRDFIVGKITKNWSGFFREAFTDAYLYGVSFPVDLDVKLKAVLLGALFLIDYVYFENGESNDCDFCP